MSRIIEDVKNAVNQLLSAAELKEGNILVVGCSSSEILGSKIGTASNEEAGREVFKAIYDIVRTRGIFLAAQCCEHLNRALVIEEACLEKYDYERVSVVPWIHAGGSFASAVTEHIKAHAGIDIGDTLIGMHLRDVAVPVRIEQKSIGEAHIVCARTRPRLIGGERARYTL